MLTSSDGVETLQRDYASSMTSMWAHGTRIAECAPMRSCLLTAFALVTACSSADPTASDSNIASSNEAIRGCRGQASSTIPRSGSMYLTSFGGPGEGQRMSCGQSTRNGSWYYAASRQRFGCGAHLQVEGNGRCVVVEADDYGPDVCVENKVGGPILDASPRVAQHLFGVDSAGWSDRRRITVTKVDDGTPLGPCVGQAAYAVPDDDDDCVAEGECDG
jgi:hypothetical protein